MHRVLDMGIRHIFLVISVVLAPGLVEAQDVGRDARRLAELNEAGSPADFEGICSGRTGAQWCSGYFSGIVSALGITEDRDCFMLIDVARIAHESVWLTTSDWLYRQPSSLRITYYEAVRRALSERESCDL